MRSERIIPQFSTVELCRNGRTESARICSCANAVPDDCAAENQAEVPISSKDSHLQKQGE